MPSAQELILRDIRDSIYDYRKPLDNWRKQEIEYLSPNNYRLIGEEEIIQIGDGWDNSGKNFYFIRDIKIPDELTGKKVFLELEIGGESAVYIDNQLKRGLNERFILLDKSARGSYNVKIEATYHIHDFVRQERKTEEPYNRHYFNTANLVVKNELINNYYILLKTTIDAAKVPIREDIQRKLEIAAKKSLTAVNFHTPDRAEYISSIAKAKEELENTLNEIEVSYPGKIQLTGNSHIDVAFKWPVKETIRKCKRTFSTAVELMDQYDDLYFAQSQPQLYEFIKEYYPDLYQKIKEKVKSGQWELIGSMWVEPDINLPSGESLVRQLLYGRNFFREEFGSVPEICWLPDTFGFSAQLPQILKKSGINYFATAKIRQNDTNKFPYNAMRWEGIDGSSVGAFLLSCRTTGDISPATLIDSWESLAEKEQVERVPYIYGYGDGGGGATSEMLDVMEAMKKIDVLPDITTGRVNENIAGVFANLTGLPTWYGEIYFERHRGVYTSQAIIKRYNRKVEFLYREVEIVSSIANLMGADIDISKLERGWKKLLMNQFHDILPGSCVKEAVEDAVRDYEDIIQIARGILEDSYNYIDNQVAVKQDSILVYNLFAWSRKDVVAVKIESDLKGIKAVEDVNGKIIPVQKEGGYLYFEVDIPSLGFQIYKIISEQIDTGDMQEEAAIPGNQESFLLENEYLGVRINASGNLDSIYDKENKREVLIPGEEGNQLQIFTDKSTYYDTWDIRISEDKKYLINDVVDIKYQARGPLYQSVLIKKKFNNSTFEQEVILYKGSRRLDFKTRVDWQERQMLLKAAFPVEIKSDKASYDIAFGNIERSIYNNTSWEKAQSEVPAHKWADLSEYGYGISIINDCKYGYDIKGKMMRITLLKGGIFPDPEADLGEHLFTYSLYPHQGGFREGGTIQESFYLNHPMHGIFSKNSGNKRLPGEFSFIKIDQENVILETLKKAEDEKGYILRVYETFGKRCQVNIDLFKDFQEVKECNLMEKIIGHNLKKAENSFSFLIKPYEIKTFNIKFIGKECNHE